MRPREVDANDLSLSSTALFNILLIKAAIKMRMAARLGLLLCMRALCGL